MNEPSEITSLMDLLDFDEDVIDARLKTIMDRNSFEPKHLTNAINLLNYKYLINLREGSNCINDEEFNFIVKLIKDVNSLNIHLVCKIITLALNLDQTNLVIQAEHLLQQIMSNFSIPVSSDENALEVDIILQQFQICDCILDVIISAGQRASLMFFEEPLENILNSSNDKVKMHFISVTASKLFCGVEGYNILDRLWSFIKDHQDVSLSLKVLSCLADYYLPVDNGKSHAISSNIILNFEFWAIILSGLQSEDHSLRKLTIYLAKRAIDCVVATKKDIKVENKSKTILHWNIKHQEELKQKWDNFFILMDSLEEKQSNIVLPSLKYFRTVKDIGSRWLNCAFNIGLQQDNTEVKLKCIEYRVQYEIRNCNEAVAILNALNDSNIYVNSKDTKIVKQQILNNLNFTYSIQYILDAIPFVKWSPVPLFHLSEVLKEYKSKAKLNLKDLKVFNEILNVPCNIVPIRNAISSNLLHFILNNFIEGYNWRDWISLFTKFNFENISMEDSYQLFQYIKVPDVEKTEFYKCICENKLNTRLGLLYSAFNPDDISIFSSEFDKKLNRIQEIVSRQYSNVLDCFNDLIYIMDLFAKASNLKLAEVFAQKILNEYSTIMKFIYRLLSDDAEVSISDKSLLFQGLKAMSSFMSYNKELNKTNLELYKSAILLLKHSGTSVNKKVNSILVINSLHANLLHIHPNELLDLNNSLELFLSLKINETENNKKEDTGRQWNILYEKSCELVLDIINHEKNLTDLPKIINFIEYIIDCGGHGCLKWILRILNQILPSIEEEGKKTKFDVTLFIDRMWKEIDELKSNNQYSVCMKEFVKLITQDSLTGNPNYNNVIIFYCSKIIEYGDSKLTPLYFLVKHLNDLNISKNSHIVYVLSEILLFSPVPRKDQRITDSVVLKVLHDPKYSVHNNKVEYTFQFQIQYQVLEILCKITDPDTFVTLEKLVMKKIDEIFRNKQRYHGNSQLHRHILAALQCLILIFLLELENKENKEAEEWCLELLGRMSHQPSVRICLEWYIALSFYCKKTVLNEDVLETLNKYNTPLNSQFTILFWMLKHKISKKEYTEDEYNFVMNILFSHTMGQMFIIRLYAQYLATELYKLKKSEKFSYFIQIVGKTLQDNFGDKNFFKLKEDFMYNGFDMFTHLNPVFIFYFIPKYFGISGFENCDIEYLTPVNNLLVRKIENGNELSKEWIECRKYDELTKLLEKKLGSQDVKSVQNSEATGTIQKKYVPWKNMSDIDAYRTEYKKVTKSDLIVVASLIDRIPNLGGMARTSEVFAVNTFVVGSIRSVEDKQFQGLSVSAERWVNIEEVRPGAPLKEYLIRKKMEGYTVVAAEQTSKSSPLQKFKFPKKCVLLLGHEKEGIPCDLLPVMDHCIEVPQQGVIRSLNVHVTAAIFVWEYNRQHVFA